MTDRTALLGSASNQQWLQIRLQDVSSAASGGHGDFYSKMATKTVDKNYSHTKKDLFLKKKEMCTSTQRREICSTLTRVKVLWWGRSERSQGGGVSAFHLRKMGIWKLKSQICPLVSRHLHNSSIGNLERIVQIFSIVFSNGVALWPRGGGGGGAGGAWGNIEGVDPGTSQAHCWFGLVFMGFVGATKSISRGLGVGMEQGWHFGDLWYHTTTTTIRRVILQDD